MFLVTVNVEQQVRPVQGRQTHAADLATAVRASVVPEALARKTKSAVVAFVGVVPILHVKIPQTRAMEPIASAEHPRHVLEMTKTHAILPAAVCVEIVPPVQAIRIAMCASELMGPHPQIVYVGRKDQLALGAVIHAKDLVQQRCVVVAPGGFRALEQI